MSIELAGTGCAPSVNGGYLVITYDGHEVGVVSVPSPIFAVQHSDTISKNFDDFEDELGNAYSVSVTSSNASIDWTVEVSNTSDESLLKKLVEVEFLANDY